MNLEKMLNLIDSAIPETNVQDKYEVIIFDAGQTFVVRGVEVRTEMDSTGNIVHEVLLKI